MASQWINDPYLAFAQLPTGLFLMASAHGEDRAGIMCKAVVPCGYDPPLICVIVRAGHKIDPILRDSRAFAISAVADHEKLIMRKFNPDHVDDFDADPFDAIPSCSLSTGSPALPQPRLVMDCEVARHFSLDSEFEIFIGHVIDTRVPNTITIA